LTTDTPAAQTITTCGITRIPSSVHVLTTVPEGNAFLCDVPVSV